jgi:hypothetical protein
MTRSRIDAFDWRVIGSVAIGWVAFYVWSVH